MSWLRRLFGSTDAAPTEDAKPDGKWPQEVVDIVVADLQRIIDLVRTSMQKAFDSDDADVRRQQSAIARANVARAQDIAAEWSFLSLDNLDAVFADLDKIDAKTERLRLLAGAITPATFDTTCECGRMFGVPLAAIEDEFSCPECGVVGRFTVDQVAAIRDVITDQASRVDRAIGGFTGGATKSG